MGESGVLGRGEKPSIKQIVKRNGQKIGEKLEKLDFFYWKWSKML